MALASIWRPLTTFAAFVAALRLAPLVFGESSTSISSLVPTNEWKVNDCMALLVKTSLDMLNGKILELLTQIRPYPPPHPSTPAPLRVHVRKADHVHLQRNA